ncbi:cell division protein PerM [Paramicrobacterium agarici]|uniref:cell division protein PerM n=1 Tax=Paramicrobacterium agarici TaxID=630514 RepID=UPI001151CEA1|nr:DUF6350 family protein [Microbacterium agarici]TQO21960.1 hypothetical protein FB385_0773 [Microbacterium agarici]
MNRLTASLLAALEAFIVVAIGVFLPLVPLTLLWAIQYDFSVDWFVFWRAAADIWLLGNGVDLTVTLNEATLQIVGIPDAAESFVVSFAPLAFALFTVLMGVRTGRRSVRSGSWLPAVITSFAVFVVFSGIVGITAINAIASPSAWQAFVVPALVWALGLVIGVAIELAITDDDDRVVQRVLDLRDRMPSHIDTIIMSCVRSATGAVALLIVGAGLVVTVSIVVGFSSVISLYQAAQVGVVGGISVTLAQIAYMPNVIIWTASWLVGPGYTLGEGSIVSPSGTITGPVPSIPLLGSLPGTDLAFGFVGLAIPLVAGFIAALSVRHRVVAAIGIRSKVAYLALSALVIGVIAGVEMALLAWWSAGAAGPARFVSVGPDPIAVGGMCAALVAVGALVGMASGSSERVASSARSAARGMHSHDR